MPRYIVVLGEEVELTTKIETSWAPSSLKTSDERIFALESKETAEEISLRLFPSGQRAKHLIFRVGAGSYYGFHDGALWDFLKE